MARHSDLPPDAVLLARDGQGQAFRYGDQLVVLRRFGDRLTTVRLPAGDLEWLSMTLTALRAASAGHVSEWMQLLEAGCDSLAERMTPRRRRR